jgi:hypothetical protein
MNGFGKPGLTHAAHLGGASRMWRRKGSNLGRTTPASHPARSSTRRLGPALISGGLAIALNMLALKAADFLPLATAKGGLLRLLRTWLSAPLAELGIAAGWSRAGAPGPDTEVFQMGFHFAVGMAMALAYAYALEPALPGGDAQKGAFYAVGVWLVNALVILPATGAGFAGSAHLTLAGIAWFAAAHTLFFLVLAMVYGAIIASARVPPQEGSS